MDAERLPISFRIAFIWTLVLCSKSLGSMVGPENSKEDMNRPNAAPRPRPKEIAQLAAPLWLNVYSDEPATPAMAVFTGQDSIAP